VVDVIDPDDGVGDFELPLQPTIDAPTTAAAVTPAAAFREMLIGPPLNPSRFKLEFV
jgi:hypothetical protein